MAFHYAVKGYLAKRAEEESWFRQVWWPAYRMANGKATDIRVWSIPEIDKPREPDRNTQVFDAEAAAYYKKNIERFTSKNRRASRDKIQSQS